MQEEHQQAGYLAGTASGSNSYANQPITAGYQQSAQPAYPTQAGYPASGYEQSGYNQAGYQQPQFANPNSGYPAIQAPGYPANHFTGYPSPGFNPPPLTPPVYDQPLSDYILYTKNLIRQYDKTIYALQNANLAIKSGQIVGILGPNGCGKTTLFRILAGMDQGYQGEVRIGGQPVGVDTKKQVSFLPDQLGLENSARLPYLLSFYQDFFPDFNMEKAKELARLFTIPENAKISQLSKGYRERFQITLVMSREVPIYLLDEPLSGVDPAARALILRALVKDFREDSTMLISTHLIHDVEMVINQAVFMQAGQIRAHREVDELRAEQGKSLNQIFQEVYYVG